MSITKRPYKRKSRVPLFNKQGHVYMTMLALLVGLVTGMAAYLFRQAIGYVAGIFEPHISEEEYNWWILIVPGIGILITSLFMKYVIHTNVAHGSAQIIRDVKHKKFRLKGNITFSPMVGGTITLGMGGSSGSEGPIAFTGAAIGSNIGKWFGLDDREVKILLGCGAAAGISAIYMAPIGGLMYVLELVSIGISVPSVVMVTSACLVAFLVPFILNGFQPYIFFNSDIAPDVSLMPLVIVLGIFCGLYSLYYSKICNIMDGCFKGMSAIWKQVFMGGLMLGIIIFMFPSMFSVGYDIVQQLINGHPEALAKGSVFMRADGSPVTLMLIAVGILLCKSFAVVATNSSGGVGGDFAPTLFAGSMAGFLFATFANHFCGAHLPVALCSLFGMAGVMAGAIQTPLMAIFIVMEFCRAHQYALPIAICAFVSYITVKGLGWTIHYEPITRHVHFFRRRIEK